MDNFVYERLKSYFDVLCKLGYLSSKTTNSLIALVYYYRLLTEDYRGHVSQEDYKLITQALTCLYWTSPSPAPS